jgi:hypothetical protein
MACRSSSVLSGVRPQGASSSHALPGDLRPGSLVQLTLISFFANHSGTEDGQGAGVAADFTPGHATDQYALACVAFTMLTASLPFKHGDPAAVLWAQMSCPPPSHPAAA